MKQKQSASSNKLSYLSAIKYLSKYISKYKHNFAMFYFGWLIITLLYVIMPIIFGIMIDEIVYYQNINTFVSIAFFFVLLTILTCILYFLIYAQHHYLMSMYTFDIKCDVFNHLLKTDVEYISEASTGDIISTIQSYANECMHFVIRNIIHTINGTLEIVIIATYLFVIDWRIGIISAIITPINVIVNTKFGKKIRGYGDARLEHYKDYVSWIFEIFTALPDIRMLGAQKRVYRIFEDNHKKMFNVNIKSGISSMTANNIILFTKLVVQLIIFIFAAIIATSGNFTVGLLTIIMAFYGELSYKVGELSGRYIDGQNRISYIQHIYDFMNTPTEDAWEGKNELTISDGKITFNSIDFAYKNSENLLKGFTLDISPGERFALAGKSGCGKTTLAYMLIGFYRPQNGYIEIDGQKLSDCNLKSIRKNIGLIQQDVLIFDGTIKENVVLGSNNATYSQIKSACIQAGLWEFIETLPDGLNTVIGTHGVELSGGQKQRVAISRIYLKNPKIIIFDEATSALDKRTEEVIHDAWKEVLKGRTSIVIAHRQSSVMLCEKAAIIENGKVVSIGNPKEMETKDEVFKTLFAIKETFPEREKEGNA